MRAFGRGALGLCRVRCVLIVTAALQSVCEGEKLYVEAVLDTCGNEMYIYMLGNH